MNNAPPFEISTGAMAFGLFASFSRAGRADTSGTDRIMPLPVPTHSLSSVRRRAVIRTKEKPNLLVPKTQHENTNHPQ